MRVDGHLDQLADALLVDRLEQVGQDARVDVVLQEAADVAPASCFPRGFPRKTRLIARPVRVTWADGRPIHA
jgi:hypothetical protein